MGGFSSVLTRWAEGVERGVREESRMTHFQVFSLSTWKGGCHLLRWVN